MSLADLSQPQWILLGLVFVWSGFVRTGIGFGGGALALPLMLFILPNPIVLLPIIAWHFIFFSILTLFTHKGAVDWRYLFYSQIFIAVPALLGIFGLINLSPKLLTIIVYCITLTYGLSYLLQLKLAGGNKVTDALLLIVGGYVSGTSMTGAPVMAAVYARNIPIEKLRNTLFMSFLSIVFVKMMTFKISGVELQFSYALMLLPVAGVGHIMGHYVHDWIVKSDSGLFMRCIGLALTVITLLGLYRMFML